jgi:hypothetical protein
VVVVKTVQPLSVVLVTLLQLHHLKVTMVVILKKADLAVVAQWAQRLAIRHPAEQLHKAHRAVLQVMATLAAVDFAPDLIFSAVLAAVQEL